jgi:hypothetical protein
VTAAYPCALTLGARISRAGLSRIGQRGYLHDRSGNFSPDQCCIISINSRLAKPNHAKLSRQFQKGPEMGKQILSLDESKPKKATRADRPPTEGFVMVVDGHFKSQFNTVEAAEESAGKLKSAYPMLRIEIYDAVNKAYTLLS